MSRVSTSTRPATGPAASPPASLPKQTSSSALAVNVKDQVRDLYDIIREEGGDEETTILAVVPNDVLPQLTDRCKSKKWKFWHSELAPNPQSPFSFCWALD